MKTFGVFTVLFALTLITMPAAADTASHLMLSPAMGVEAEFKNSSYNVDGAMVFQGDGNFFANEFAPKDDIGLHLELGVPADMKRMPRIGIGPVFKLDNMFIQMAAVQQLYLKEDTAMMGASITPTVVFGECLAVSYRATIGAIVPNGKSYISHLIGVGLYFPEKMFR